MLATDVPNELPFKQFSITKLLLMTVELDAHLPETNEIHS